MPAANASCWQASYGYILRNRANTHNSVCNQPRYLAIRNNWAKESFISLSLGLLIGPCDACRQEAFVAGIPVKVAIKYQKWEF